MKFIFLFTLFLHISFTLQGGADLLAVKQLDGKMKLSEITVKFYKKLSKLLKADTDKKAKLKIDGKEVTTTLSVNLEHEIQPTDTELSALETNITELNLNMGKHIIEFKLNNYYSVNSNLYVFNYDDKIIVSDIDGTITKSDVRGHILNALGIDWTHDGVVDLFTHLASKGYKFIYLTARPLLMKDSTKNYVQGVNQDGGNKLPLGPVILNTDSFFSSVYLEMIKRKPQEFKIACLTKLFKLFKEKAFKYGFGNKETDKITYQTLGVEDENIILVTKNSKMTDPSKFVGKTYRELVPLLN